MRAFSRVHCIALIALSLAIVGCRQNGIVPAPMYQNQLQATQQLQARAATLDQVNNEKERQLAETRRQFFVVQDELKAVKERLKTTAAQLAQAREEKLAAEQRAEQAIASNRARGGATITANNSLNRNRPQFNIPGVSVISDSDVVRVQIAASSLFQPHTANLQGNASTTLNQVASELARLYPNQIIGIEGHTGTAPLAPPAPGHHWQNHHHLSTTRAMTVYNHLAAGRTLQSEQLHVAGHGPNHPRYSTASASAQDANGRIELVVYPEQARRLGR